MEKIGLVSLRVILFSNQLNSQRQTCYVMHAGQGLGTFSNLQILNASQKEIAEGG